MDDSISRQAAIDELKRISFSHWFECGEYLSEDTRKIEIINSNKALEAINALPSAQPEVIRCKDCKFADWDLDGEGGYCNKMDVNDPFYVDYDFFCAKAERKKNESD